MPASSSLISSDGTAAAETGPLGMVTFLFSDIQGSTQLWEAQPGSMPAALARHDAILQAAIEAAGGRVFKNFGDAFHAVFEQPEAALAAALAAQTALLTEGWGLDGGAALRVRIALHTGGAERRSGDYFGAALSRTARLLAAGHGGQTLLSEATAVHVSEALPDGVRLRSLGRHRLKDLAQPQEIFQVLALSLPDDFPPLRSWESLPHNLPAQLTSFVGRDMEMATARELLAKSRLLTLAGTGGSGKTRLAMQVAADVLENYADGVWLVELASLSDPSLVSQEVAGVLGVREESEKRLRQTLIDTLRPKSLLLILDNCEHLIESAARLAETLLQACPTLTVLATSREALGIGGEAVLPLPPLSLLAAGALPMTPEALAGCEAVRLFVERATAAQPAFRFSAGNAAAVASVCARLDGIPLALELAAARVKVLTPEQIDGRLDDRFRLLSGGSRTALPRQQTLKAAIDWSYDLLTKSEKALLRRLSVFGGGWTLEAAETICAGDAAEEGEILDLLSHLAAKSLIVVEPPVAGQVRYHLLESIRSYTRERLAETPDAPEALARRHRDFFLAFAEEAEPSLSGPNQVLWLNRVEGDLENLRAALSVARSQRDLSLPRLAGALSHFWYWRSYLSEGMGWLEEALAEATEADGRVLGKILNGAGMLSWCCGDYDKSRAFHKRDLALRRELEDARGIARALGNLSITASDQKQLDLAEAYGQESLARYQALGDQENSTKMLTNLGIFAADREDYLEAERLYKEALAAYRVFYDASANADVLHNLGELFFRQGLYDRAKPYFRESLLAQRTVGSKQRIATTLTHLAATAGAEGDDARVCLLWGAAERILQAGGITAFEDDRQYQVTLENSRAALGEEQFQVFWSQGHQMDTAQVISFVLRNYAELPR